MIWYKKIIIWYICSYLIESSQNLLEEILTNNFFRYRSWFETFLYLLIGDGGGASLKV